MIFRVFRLLRDRPVHLAADVEAQIRRGPATFPERFTNLIAGLIDRLAFSDAIGADLYPDSTEILRQLEEPLREFDVFPHDFRVGGVELAGGARAPERDARVEELPPDRVALRP